MTQYLPPDDSFEESTGKITDHPALWVRYTPWTTLTPDAAFPWTLSFSNLEFFDRYTGHERVSSIPGTYIEAGGIVIGGSPEAPRNCVVAYRAAVAPLTPDQLHGGGMFRLAEGLNVNVKASFYTLHTEPYGDNLYGVGSCGIGARLSGGTNYGSGLPNTERVADGDGYWFVLGMDSMSSGGANPLSIDFHLIRVNAGVATVLATEVYDATPGSHYTKNALKEGAPFQLRMTVETSGGTVAVRCYHKPMYSFGSWAAGVERLSISYDDTSVSRITSSGRFGLFNSSEYYSGTSFEFAIPCCGWFQANLLGSSVIFREEWSRAYREESNLVTSHVGVNTFSDYIYGHSLQSGYINDTYGYARESYIYDTALPSTGLDGLEFDFDVINGKDSTSCGVTLISARLADDPVNQDRSIDFYFDSTGNATNLTTDADWLYFPASNSSRSAGIVLRSSSFDHTKYSYPEPQIGYACAFVRDDLAGTTALRVYRYTSDGLRYTIAESAVGPTLALDTWYTVRMRIASIQGPGGTIDDAAEIKVYLDSIQQVPTASWAGITVDSSGTIYDESSIRILSGPQEGIRINTADNTALGSPRKTYVDNWEQGAGAGPDDPDESDQASITVGREDDGASGTLTLDAAWPVSVEDTYGRREHRFEYGEYRYANATMLKPRRLWTIQASAVTESVRTALRVFWNAHHGVARGFTWVTDEGESITGHFFDDALETALRAPGVTSFTIRIEELFDGA